MILSLPTTQFKEDDDKKCIPTMHQNDCQFHVVSRRWTSRLWLSLLREKLHQPNGGYQQIRERNYLKVWDNVVPQVKFLTMSCWEFRVRLEKQHLNLFNYELSERTFTKQLTLSTKLQH